MVGEGVGALVAVATAVEGTRVARVVGTVWAAGGKSAWHAGRISAIDSKLSKREICRFLLVKVINRYALFSSPENPDLVEIFVKTRLRTVCNSFCITLIIARACGNNNAIMHILQ